MILQSVRIKRGLAMNINFVIRKKEKIKNIKIECVIFDDSWACESVDCSTFSMKRVAFHAPYVLPFNAFTRP